jgi:hypothetical protein
MDQAIKDAEVKQAISAAIERFLGRANIRKIVVNAIDDYSGDPALYINIHLNQADLLPSIEQRSKLRDVVRQELLQRDDDRFPYITILSTSWGPEGERKSA